MTDSEDDVSSLDTEALARLVRRAFVARREELGLSYSEIARRVDSSVPSVLSVMKSEGDMRLRTLTRFGAALELDVTVLFRDVGVDSDIQREAGSVPGIRKTAVASRISDLLIDDGVEMLSADFSGRPGKLPWQCTLQFDGHSQRSYDIYFWTVSHGGRSRRSDEYRIQTKLDTAANLVVRDGTTILAGYYNEVADLAGKREGNNPPPGMEVFAFWNAVKHLELGASSSCQVPFGLLYEAYLRGRSQHERRLANGQLERIIAVRPEYVGAYLKAAAGGHQQVRADALAKIS